MKAIPKSVLKAKQKQWGAVRRVQDELSSQYIHDKLSLLDVATDAYLAKDTVRRFFHRGKLGDKLGYSYLHGPRATTIFAIAGAIGCELVVQRRGDSRAMRAARILTERREPAHV